MPNDEMTVKVTTVFLTKGPLLIKGLHVKAHVVMKIDLSIKYQQPHLVESTKGRLVELFLFCFVLSLATVRFSHSFSYVLISAYCREETASTKSSFVLRRSRSYKSLTFLR